MSLAPSTTSDPNRDADALSRDSETRHDRWQARAYGWLPVVLLSLPVVVPTLLEPIEDRGADSFLHIYRSTLFSEALDSGWLYPRCALSLNAGLGSPVFSFYSPAAYYAMTALRHFGLSPIHSYRVLSASALLLAAIGTYALALAFGCHAGVALFASVAYLYAPALLRDTWQRGSPQGLVFALLPLTLFALLRLADRPTGIRMLLASIAVSLLFYTHVISAIIAMPLILILGVYLAGSRGKLTARNLACALALGVLLSALHMGPILLERGSIQSDRINWAGADPSHTGIALRDLGILPSYPDVGIPNQSGLNYSRVDLFQISMILAGIAAMPAVRKRFGVPGVVLLASSVTLALLAVFLQLQIATPFWSLDGMRLLQFRWRLMSLVAPSVLFVTIALARTLKSKNGTAVAVCLSALLISLSAPGLLPQLLPVVHTVQGAASPAEIARLALNEGVPDLSTGEFQPIWREWGYSEEEMKWAGLTPIANLPEGAQWLSDVRTPRSRTTRFVSPVPFDASLHLLYFPGWQVTVDGQPATAYPSQGGGYLTVPVPAGEHEIFAYYGGTPVQHVSAAISGLAMLVCVVLAIAWRPHSTEVPAEPVALERPRWEVAAVIALLVAAKLLWIDPHTTLFRHASTRDAIYGATAQVDVAFDDAILLHGYRLDDVTLEPGQEVEITLYWSADGFPDKQYPGSFVHLLGDDLNEARGDYLWGQSDSRHRPGQWEQGKLFADIHSLVVDPSAPEGPYSLEIGWWWPETGKQSQAEIKAGTTSMRVAEPGYMILSGLEVVHPPQ